MRDVRPIRAADSEAAYAELLENVRTRALAEGVERGRSQARDEALALLEGATTRIEEIHVDPNSDVVGKALRDTRIRQDSELLVLAVRDATGSYRFNPGADFVIDGGMTLVVLGETHCVQKLQARVGA